MSKLDFSNLSDDQLIQFTWSIWEEVIKRGNSISSAGKFAILEE